MGNCTYENWTLKALAEAIENKHVDKKQIVVPLFQRGVRWKRQQELTFIDSLRRGFPVGTMLFYRTIKHDKDNKVCEVFTLIDGLQRGNTIKKYISSPMTFFDSNEVDDFFVNTICETINISNSEKDKILNIVVDVVKDININSNSRAFKMASRILDCFNIDKITYLETLVEICANELNKFDSEYEKIANTNISIIIYTGEEESLPDIFARVNSQGTPLTPYEIYAATWPKDKIKIDNVEIVNEVIKKYDSMESDGFEMEDYNKYNILKTKNLTIFEYIFGLSKYLNKKFSILNFVKKPKDDEVDTMAFELINACFNDSAEGIKTLYEKVREVDINLFEKALIDSIQFVEQNVGKLSSFKGNKRKENKILHSKFQIMSMISVAMRSHYHLEGSLEIKSEWSTQKNIFNKTFLHYYIYDILRKEWFDGGTSKIYAVAKNGTYSHELSLSNWITVLKSWFNDQLNIKEKTNIASPGNQSIIFLNQIYLNIFTANDQLSCAKFDVEHLATKEIMKKLIKKTNSIGLPISCIANLCYLPEYDNRSKGALTLYQDKNYIKKLEAKHCTIKNIEEKYSFTDKNDLCWIDISHEIEDSDCLKDYYFEYLRNRYKRLMKKFLLSLDYDVDDEDLKLDTDYLKDGDDIIDSDVVITRDFIIKEKIGKVAKTMFTYLLKNHLLSDNELQNLMNAEYSRINLGVQFPVLVINNDEKYDRFGRNRYYKDTIHCKDSEYFLCKEWFEHDKSFLLKWYSERESIFN